MTDFTDRMGGRSSAEPLEAPGQGEPEFIAVKVQTAPDIAFGKEQVLFTGDYTYGEAAMRCYDVGPGARWFVIPSADHSTGPTQIQVVVNWVDLIEQRFVARR